MADWAEGRVAWCRWGFLGFSQRPAEPNRLSLFLPDAIASVNVFLVKREEGMESTPPA
jgi:hypothetical protein